MQNLKITVDICSNKGIKEENQDACGFKIPTGKTLEYKGIAIAIADGVSASSDAKEASNACVNGFLSDYYSTPDSWSVEHCAGKIFSSLNSSLYSKSIRDEKPLAHKKQSSSMLSTLSVVVIKSNTAHIFHIGDSRVYLFRDEKINQLTKDHSIAVGENKTYLSRAMGFDLKVDVDYKTIDLKTSDRLLLSTDGVHDFIDESTLENLLKLGKSAQQINTIAKNNNSIDNISVMLVDVVGLPEKNLDEVFEELTQKPIPPDLNNGMKINGFEILSLMNSSPTIQLYKAQDIQTKKIVVLKTPSVNFEDDAAYLTRFNYEQWAGRRIDSPNVVKVYKSHAEEKFLAYALDYVDGLTLREWIIKNPTPEITAVVVIVKQIIIGLRAFHRQEMLHCDLKPENIMLDKNGIVKIIDFGSVRIAGVSELSSPVIINENAGTMGYTAPEVILDNQVSKRSDRFSLGIIVYEMLTGKLPFGERLNKDLSRSKLTKITYTKSLQYNKDLPIWVDGALEKACNLDYSKRYKHLSKFLFDLENPNDKFIYKQEKVKETMPKKYRLIFAISVLLNFILLLIFVSEKL